MEQEVVEVGAWRSKVVPLYLWSSKTDCGQASAWSLALNLSEQATKGWSGIPFRYRAVHFKMLRWPGNTTRQDIQAAIGEWPGEFWLELWLCESTTTGRSHS
jgi:hypothetical protein